MKKIMLPAGRPAAEGVNNYLHTLVGNDQYKVKLLGIRGYYKKTMGNPVINDEGIYDDAIFLVTPNKVIAYNANTDPSVKMPKVAVLQVGGPYLYKKGMHNMKAPSLALRQFGRVTVLRDGVPHTDTAAAPFYIDIHKGGYGTTSSLGCQTIYPDQWPEFLKTVLAEMEKYWQTVIPYWLTENK